MNAATEPAPASEADDVYSAEILARATPGYRVHRTTDVARLSVVIGRVDVDLEVQPDGLKKYSTHYHLPEFLVDDRAVTRADFEVICQMIALKETP